GRDHDVLWLDVAMDNPFRVRGSERICSLSGNTGNLFNSQLVTLHSDRQRLPLDILDGHEAKTGMRSNLIDGADVRMVQLRCSFGLLDKAPWSITVGDLFLRQNLEGHSTF